MKRILLIEDDPHLRLSLKIAMEEDGFQVIEAANGDEGIQRFMEDPTDLVVTDLFMPKKEGLETIAELKASHPDVKIIAISGAGKQIPGGLLVFAKTIGAHHTFEKPIDLTDFTKVIRELIED